MTNSIEDIGEASCIFAIGTNTSDTHPVIGTRVRHAVLNGGSLIVANPRHIPLVKYATYFLQLRPGTNIALLMGMARAIIDEDLQDKNFIKERCEKFEEFKRSLDAFPLSLVSEVTGVEAELIRRAAILYATKRPSSLLYAMGITQHAHGTDNVMATANLAMLTGNVGKPGTGVNPLRGQNNVQGACDMGALPNVFSGYQAVTDSDIRQKFEAAWGVDSLPPDAGLTLPDMIRAIDAGQIKAVYMVGENVAVSEPDLNNVRAALKKLEFLVVQDIFLTESTPYAHVVLPAASFAEKEGTFTNTERRVQWLNRIVPPPGEARPDWWIVSRIAAKMGGRGFDYQSAGEILSEINKVTPSYAGITSERLKSTSLQWPCVNDEHGGTPVLHTYAFTRGKGHFEPLSHREPRELPDESYPFVLTTARSLYQYHTGTMTRKVSGLNTMRGEEFIEINPGDAVFLGIKDLENVRVTSRRGAVETKALLSDKTPPGVVTMDFHFAESPVNMITNPVHDPVSKIPEYKACAVRIERI
ncbi:MAG: molybdopterin-dependent oxidoreductase [Syntrophales bacterium]|nr:molybdopterin-dependent oxidoreductase [Syntrophales bacterium]